MSNEHREQAREIIKQVLDAVPTPTNDWSISGSRDFLSYTTIETIAERFAAAFSSRDIEIREVLEGLRNAVAELDIPHVGRPGNEWTQAIDAAIRTIERVREPLWSKLQPKEASDERD